METTYLYLALSGALTVLLWVPYILARLAVWGLPTFLRNYPEGFPAVEPTSPLWAERARRAHLNMVETLPALVAVVLAAGVLAAPEAWPAIGTWSAVFFFSRLAYTAIYISGIPFLRTPAYLVSWVAVLMIVAETMT